MDYFANDKVITPERGDLLISEPYLPDPNFERTVIFLCEHNEKGSLGVILNKQSGELLPEYIEDVDGFDAQLYIGGPVQQETLHFLHNSPHRLKGGRKIADGVYWGEDFEELLSSIRTKQVTKEELKFFNGYSGWSSGQLMEELEAKFWIVHKSATFREVFQMNPEELWKDVLRGMGGKFRVISNYPVDPRLN